MAQSDNQRLKLLYLVKIFSEQTDDDHGLSLKEIASRLNGYNITADRKTLYSDFEHLRLFGFDIVSVQQGRDLLYHLGKRRFELPELKLLVDSVQSAKFLTEKKSNELISKLESLCSTYEAKHLQRQVVISGRVKTMNESIYYTIDVLHEAINANRQIRFHYYRWNTKKKMELRKNGAYYRVSPWSLMWDNEYYYLVAYDPEEKMIKHYRVDKMLHLSIIDKPREGAEAFSSGDILRYTQSLFGMYGGKTQKVTLEGRNDLVGVVIDRFGKDIQITEKGSDTFTATVEVTISRQFLGWIFAVGDGLRITAPEPIVDLMREEAKALASRYQ